MKQVLLAGGVAANKGLRTALSAAFDEIQDVELVIPPLKLCTDNAAMIAAVGSILFEKGHRAGFSLECKSWFRHIHLQSCEKLLNLGVFLCINEVDII